MSRLKIKEETQARKEARRRQQAESKKASEEINKTAPGRRSIIR